MMLRPFSSFNIVLLKGKFVFPDAILLTVPWCIPQILAISFLDSLNVRFMESSNFL